MNVSGAGAAGQNRKHSQARELVLEILLEVLERGQFSHIVLRETLEKYAWLDKQERAFITRVTEGAIERVIELDYILDQFSRTPTADMKPVIRNILRAGVYQILYMDSVADFAACNESVNLAVRKGFSPLRGFVNGVLRNILRSRDRISYPAENSLHGLSVRYSTPEWIIADWQETYGEAVARKMLEAQFQEQGTTIRCDKNKISKKYLINILKERNITVKEHLYLDYALEIRGYDSLQALDPFREGKFYVQDISSMLVGEIANVQPGDYVMDVCGAPGGKALHLAEKLRGTGMVDVRDISQLKVDYINQNIERAGLTNIRAKIQDALEFDSQSVEQADVVVADLPCSGLGVIGKKPEIKYRMSREKQRELARLQREMLETIHSYVKIGGVLIYSTCTISRQENEENMAWFLERHKFTVENPAPFLAEGLHTQITDQGYLQILPGSLCGDGFFIARLRRTG